MTTSKGKRTPLQEEQDTYQQAAKEYELLTQIETRTMDAAGLASHLELCMKALAAKRAAFDKIQKLLNQKDA